MPQQAPVSVVVPCFRCARTVGEALRSAYAQTVSPQEAVVVDDASDDDTAVVLGELQAELGERWLRVIRLERNRGPASARNAGWDAAHGEFIAFLDADDTWHPRKIELQHRYMAGHPEVRVSAHRSVFAARGRGPQALPQAPGVQFPGPMKFLFTNPFVTPSVMLRKDLPYRFREGRRHMEDHLLWQTMALAGERIALLDAPLAIIHKAAFGEGGLSAELWQMEKGELENYRLLRREGRIGAAAMVFFLCYSLAKHARRLLVVALR